MNNGAAPTMELGELTSEVHHLDRRLTEHHDRFEKLDDAVATLVRSLGETSGEVKHLSRVLAWVGVVMGGVLITALGTIAVKLLR
jgi:hypothetical protein